MSRPLIVCLCGSTRFAEEFHCQNVLETAAGHIVLSIGVNLKYEADLLILGRIDDAMKTRLDALHFHKIDLADEVLVLNVDGYVGESTKNEILYAIQQKKPIRWLVAGYAYSWMPGYKHVESSFDDPAVREFVPLAELKPVAGVPVDELERKYHAAQAEIVRLKAQLFDLLYQHAPIS